MKWITEKLIFVIVPIVAVLLIGCGNGIDGTGIDGTGSDPVYLQGTATTGSPISNTKIFIKGRDGLRLETTTDDSGKFNTIVTSLKPPYLIKTITQNNTFYSIAVLGGVYNIHPLTDLVARNYFARNQYDIESEFDRDRGSITKIDALIIDKTISALDKILVKAYDIYSIPESFNFLNSNMNAGNNAFNLLLGRLKIAIVDGLVNVNLSDKNSRYSAKMLTDLALSTDFTVDDILKPSKPTLVRPIAASDSKVLMVWYSSIDNFGVAGYNVYRGNPKKRVATLAIPFFEDINLEADAQYCYEIEAFDGENNISDRSNNACVITLSEEDKIPPNDINGITVTAVSKTQINIFWDAGTDLLGYHIYKEDRNNKGEFSKITTVINTSFTDENLQPGTQYCYKIIAFDAAGNRSTPQNNYCAITSGERAPDKDKPATKASVNSGTYQSVQKIKLVCDDYGGSGCDNIYYTLDGSTPSISSKRFTSDIVISTNTTLRYFSIDVAGNVEIMNANVYKINLPTDNISPITTISPDPTKDYPGYQVVVLNCNDVGANSSGCKNSYYTTDKTTQLADFDVYKGPFSINFSTELRFFSTDFSLNSEEVNTVNYTITASETFPLQVTVNDDTGSISSNIIGINCGNGATECAFDFPVNSLIVLSATHPLNLKTIWSGCNVISNNQCSIKITDSASVSIDFTPLFVEKEPNDSIILADFIAEGSSVIGYFNEAEDADFFKLKTEESGSLIATISHPTTSSYLYLYDEMEQQLASAGPGRDISLAMTLPVATYFLKVVSETDKIDPDVPYDLQLSGKVLGGNYLDRFEPNDSMSDAAQVTSISDYRAYFGTQNDIDYYQFTVDAAGTFRTTISHDSIESYLTLIDGDGNIIASSGRSKIHSIAESLSPNDYYLEIKPTPSLFDLQEPYKLKLAGTVLGGRDLDINEENNSRESATPINTSGQIQGYFDTSSDIDYFKFEVLDTGTFQATLSHNSVKSEFYLYFNKNTFATTASRNNRAHAISKLLTPGFYSLQLNAMNKDYDVFSPYDLTISGSVFGDIRPDVNEVNDTIGNAVDISNIANIEGFFEAQNEIDYFTFDVSTTAGTFYASLTHDSLASTIMLYKAESATQYFSYSSGVSHTLSQTLPVGKYYISFTSGSFDLINPYSVIFSGSVFNDTRPDQNEENDTINSATPIASAGGGDYQGYFETENDIDCFEFTAGTVGSFYFSVSHDTVSSQFTLFNSDELPIWGPSRNLTNGSQAKSLKAGKYFLCLTPVYNSLVKFDLSNPYLLQVSGGVFGDIGPDAHEPNDTSQTATTIDSTLHTEGYFDTANDVDYYKFIVSGEGSYSFGVTMTHSSYNRLNLLNDKKQLIATSYNRSHSLIDTLPAGTYYLQVEASTMDLTNAYKLEFFGTAFGVSDIDNFESNNSVVTAADVVTDGLFSATFSTENDIDYYRFETTVVGNFKANLSHYFTSSTISLYSDTDTIVPLISRGGKNNLELTRQLSKGIYYLKVIPDNAVPISNEYYELEFSYDVLVK